MVSGNTHSGASCGGNLPLPTMPRFPLPRQIRKSSEQTLLSLGGSTTNGASFDELLSKLPLGMAERVKTRAVTVPAVLGESPLRNPSASNSPKGFRSHL